MSDESVEGLASILSYSRTRGVFAGVNLKGSVGPTESLSGGTRSRYRQRGQRPVRRAMTISLTDLLKLPPGVMAAVLVMLWPAMWAGASLLVAFAGDVIRRAEAQVHLNSQGSLTESDSCH